MMSASKLCLIAGLGFDAFSNITCVSSLALDHADLVPLSRPDTQGRAPIRRNVSVAVAGDQDRTNCVLQCPVVDNITANPSNVVVSASWDATVISAYANDSAEVSVWASPRAKLPLKAVCTRGTDSCVKLAQLPGRRRLVCVGANLSVITNNSPLTVVPQIQCANPRPNDGGQCWTIVSHLPTTGVPTCVGCTANGTVFWVQAERGRKAVLRMLESCDGPVLEPVEVPLPFSGEVAVRVACGSSHTLILGQTGSVYSMGLGSRGQLGHGSILSSSAPQLVEALAGLQVVAVEAGGWHSLALSSCGDVYTWGWNHDGQLGLGMKGRSSVSALGEREVVAEPALVIIDGCDDLQFVNASCGSRHAVAVSADLRVWGWGWSAYGQVGIVACRVAHPVEISVESFSQCGWQPCNVQCGPWNTFIVMSQSPSQTS